MDQARHFLIHFEAALAVGHITMRYATQAGLEIVRDLAQISFQWIRTDLLPPKSKMTIDTLAGNLVALSGNVAVTKIKNFIA